METTMNQLTFCDYNQRRLEDGLKRYFNITNSYELRDAFFSMLCIGEPPIDMFKMKRWLECRNPSFEFSDESMEDFITRKYGREAVDFIKEFSGMTADTSRPFFCGDMIDRYTEFCKEEHKKEMELGVHPSLLDEYSKWLKRAVA